MHDSSLTSSHDLKWFAAEVGRRAAIIHAPDSKLPTYGRSEDFARPHIEFDGHNFHFVVVECGIELARRSSPDPEEILYEVFESAAFSMASDFELCHRRSEEDFRRQLFDKQLEILGQLSASWRQRTRDRLDEILSRHPFRDTA